MSTKSRNQRLHLLIIKCPDDTPTIHVTFKYALWRNSETVKELAVPVFVEEHADPMLAGLISRVGVDDDDRWS